MMTLNDLSGLYWRPRFDYLDCDVPISFELLLPQRPWIPRSTAVGGYDESTAGVQESFVLRHDRIYRLRLRMTETEFAFHFEPMIRTLWGQAQDFTVYLDANDVTTAHDVALVRPWMGDGLEPTETDLPGVFEVAIDVRTADGSVFTYPYFSDLDEVAS